MRDQRSILFILLISLLISAGCTTSGAFLAGNRTDVQLSRANYRIVQTGVSGSANAAYVLGFSYSTGPTTNTLAIARVEGSEALYKEATDQLWANYARDHGSVEGKQLALANIRYDTDILNLFFYNEVTITVRADIVEFTAP